MARALFMPVQPRFESKMAAAWEGSVRVKNQWNLLNSAHNTFLLANENGWLHCWHWAASLSSAQRMSWKKEKGETIFQEANTPSCVMCHASLRITGRMEQSSRGPWQCALREFIPVWLPKSCWTGLKNRLIMTTSEYRRCSPRVVERAKGSTFAPPISAIVHDFTWSQLWLECFLHVGTPVLLPHAYIQWPASTTLQWVEPSFWILES